MKLLGWNGWAYFGYAKSRIVRDPQGKRIFDQMVTNMMAEFPHVEVVNWETYLAEKIYNKSARLRKRAGKEDPTLKPSKDEKDEDKAARRARMRQYVKSLEDGSWKEHLDESDIAPDTSLTDKEFISRQHDLAKKLEEGREQLDLAKNKEKAEAQTTNEPRHELHWDPGKEGGPFEAKKGIQVTMAFCFKGKRRGDVFFPEEYVYTENEDGDEELTMAAFAEQRPSEVEAYKDKTPAEVYHGHLTYTGTINGKYRVAKVKFVEDGMECFCSMDESLENKWWWYGHWGIDGETNAKDVHMYPPKDGETTNSQIAEKIPKRNKRMANPEDAGPKASKKQVKRRRKLVKNPDAEASCAESSSDDDQILSKRKGKN